MEHTLPKFTVLRSAVLATVLLLSTIALVPARADAYVLIGHRLRYGVGNYGGADQHYFIDTSASSYTSTIQSAMNDWIYTTGRIGVTTPVSYTRTTVKSSSSMDIYAVSSVPGTPYGTLACTTFHAGDGTLLDPERSDWVWGKIRFVKQGFDTLSTFNKKGTCSHEMGHVMGLDENNTRPSSCMCQLGYGRTVSNAQRDDANGINAIY